MRSLLWAALILVQLAGAEALAQRGAKIFGTWRSSTGNTFVVQDLGGRGFGLLWTQPNGVQATLRGQWVRGMRGTQFEYWTADGHTLTGTFSGEDPDRIQVTTADGAVTWWQRQVAAAPAPSGGGIYGNWTSTSGNVFQIQNAPGRGFLLWLTRPGGAQQAMRGQWVRGMRGTQFQYWDGSHSYTGTFSGADANRIRVLASNGTVGWWQRQVAAPSYPPPGRRMHHRHPPYAGDEVAGELPHIQHLRQAQRLMETGLVALNVASQTCRDAMSHNLQHSVQTLQALQLGATPKSISDHSLFVAGMVLASALAKCPESVMGPVRHANVLVQSAKNSYP